MASVQQVQEALRDLAAEMGRLNHAVGLHVALRPGDLEVLDAVARFGPVSPTWLADSLSVHPATLTGVLDRLESGGWTERRPDPTDRRRVLVHALSDRGGELRRLYAPMAGAVAELCAAYSPAELTVVLDFLRQARRAGERTAPPPPDGEPTRPSDRPSRRSRARRAREV